MNPVEIGRSQEDPCGHRCAGDRGRDFRQLRPVAFVVPAAGTTPTKDEVIAAARSIIAAFKVPARVWLVDEFPTTQSANGIKVQRSKLHEMALERLAATSVPSIEDSH